MQLQRTSILPEKGLSQHPIASVVFQKAKEKLKRSSLAQMGLVTFCLILDGIWFFVLLQVDRLIHDVLRPEGRASNLLASKTMCPTPPQTITIRISDPEKAAKSRQWHQWHRATKREPRLLKTVQQAVTSASLLVASCY